MAENETELLSGGADEGVSAAAPFSGGQATLTPPRSPADAVAIAQMLSTGSQGPAMSALASDAAKRRDAITKILSSQLERVAHTGGSGFSDVGSALSKVIATGGRASYGEAINALEGGRLSKIANAANALSAMDKLSLREHGRGAGGLDQFRLGQMIMRQTEAQARQGNAKAQLLQRSVTSAAREFSDPSAAQAFLYAHAAQADKDGKVNSASDVAGVIADGINQYRRSGGRSAYTQTAARGGGQSSEISNVPMSGGEIDYTKPLRGRSEFVTLYNASSPEQRKQMMEARRNRIIGGSGVGGGDGKFLEMTTADGSTIRVPLGGRGDPVAKEAGNTIKTEIQSDDWNYLTGRTRELVLDSGPAALGATGWVVREAEAVLTQLGALTGKLSEADFQGAARMADPKLLSKLANKIGLTGTAENSARIQALVLSLASAHAKAMDPGGRVTKDDLDKALRILGERSGSPAQLLGALDELDRQVRAARQNRRRLTNVQESGGRQAAPAGGGNRLRFNPDTGDFE